MSILEQVTTLINKYDLYPTKRFGQNFLIDENILKKIIDVADIKDKEVIEIGPGLGSLTSFLVKEAKLVTAYEVDNRVTDVLNKEFNFPNLIIKNEDFLKVSLDFNNKKIVVANIPYNITSDILFKLFENNNKFEYAILMIQKEVADRLVSKVKTKHYGKLAVTSQYFANIENLFDVKPSSFYPSPKVTSTIIKLTFNNVNYDSSRDFIKFIKNIFAQQRKTLHNNLKNIFGNDKAKNILDEFNKQTTTSSLVRPQELTLEQINLLYEISKKY